MAKAQKKKDNNGGANLGFEAKLWATADKLRGNMEPSDYKHVALGLIFLKYISAVFEAKRETLLQEELADPEDPEEYLAENESAVEVMGDDQFRVIAHELPNILKKNVSIDWAQREPSRARIRVLVKQILRKYGYLPDLQDAAVETVLQQAEVLSERWAV